MFTIPICFKLKTEFQISCIFSLTFRSLGAKLNPLEVHSLRICASRDGAWQVEQLSNGWQQAQQHILLKHPTTTTWRKEFQNMFPKNVLENHILSLPEIGSRSAATKRRNTAAVLNFTACQWLIQDLGVIWKKKITPTIQKPSINLVNPFLMRRNGSDGDSVPPTFWTFKSKGSRYSLLPEKRKLTQQVIQSSMQGMSAGLKIMMELKGTLTTKRLSSPWPTIFDTSLADASNWAKIKHHHGKASKPGSPQRKTNCTIKQK